jgi:hypothetical protein
VDPDLHKDLTDPEGGMDIGVSYSQARGLLTKRFIYTYRRNAAVPSTYIYIYILYT